MHQQTFALVECDVLVCIRMRTAWFQEKNGRKGQKMLNVFFQRQMLVVVESSLELKLKIVKANGRIYVLENQTIMFNSPIQKRYYLSTLRGKTSTDELLVLVDK